MKKIIFAFSILLALVNSSCEKAEVYGVEALQTDDWKYSVLENGDINLIEFIGKITDTLNIPSSIDGKKVSQISGSFATQKGLLNQEITNVDLIVEVIKINSDIDFVNDFAFSYIGNLREVIGFEKIKNFGTGVFLNDPKFVIKGDEFSKDLTVIGYRAFEGCTLMADSIDLSNRGEMAIAQNSFKDCSNLSKIDLGGTTVTMDLSCVSGTKVPFASLLAYLKLKDIPENFLANNQEIVDLDFSEWPLETIGANAFKGSSLKHIVLPETVHSIGESAFAGSTIQEIDLSHTKIVSLAGGYSAVFGNCTQLKSIALPSTLKTMTGSGYSVGAFLSGCSALEELNLEYIQDAKLATGALYGLTSLRVLTLSPYCEEVGFLVFGDPWPVKNTNLEEIIFTRNVAGSMTTLPSFTPGRSEYGFLYYNNDGVFKKFKYPAGSEYGDDQKLKDIIAQYGGVLEEY